MIIQNLVHSQFSFFTVYCSYAGPRWDLSHSRVRLQLVFADFNVSLNRCCAAAWEKKMRDTVEMDGDYPRKGAAASAAVRHFFRGISRKTNFGIFQFFLFVSMIVVIINFILRLISRPSQSFTP